MPKIGKTALPRTIRRKIIKQNSISHKVYKLPSSVSNYKTLHHNVNFISFSVTRSEPLFVAGDKLTSDSVDFYPVSQTNTEHKNELHSIRIWAIENNVKGTAVTCLLKILLYIFEKDMKSNPDLRSDLVSLLETKGGNTPNQIVYRSVAALMMDELMVSFTFAGHTAGKESFKDSLFLNLICTAVRSQPLGAVSSDKDIENAIEYWIKRASYWLKKRSKGSSMQDLQDEDEPNGPTKLGCFCRYIVNLIKYRKVFLVS